MIQLSARSGLYRKVLAGLAVGVVTYLVSSLTPADPDGATPDTWQLVLTVLAAGAAFMVAFLVEFQRQLDAVAAAAERRAAETSEQVGRQVRQLTDATTLFGLLEHSAVPRAAVEELIRAAARIDRTASPLVTSFAQAELDRTTEVFRSLGGGQDLRYDGEDRDWLLALTHSASTTIDATSLTFTDAGGRATDGGFWLSDLGQRYLEAQREALARDVRIRRVFVLDDSSLLDDPGLLGILDLHRSLGVEVRVLDPARAAARRSSLFDFIVFDDMLAYEVTPASIGMRVGREVSLATRLVLTPDRVDERVHRFEDIWNAARQPETARQQETRPQPDTGPPETRPPETGLPEAGLPQTARDREHR